VDGQPCSRRELGLAEVELDAAEPREQRAASEGTRTTPQLDPVEDGDVVNLPCCLLK
jgi:hypothetical protein